MRAAARKRKVLSPEEAKVVEILAAVAGVDEDEITRDARLVDDLGLDSLDVVEACMDLEQAFGVAIDVEQLDIWETGTVADVLKTLARLEATL